MCSPCRWWYGAIETTAIIIIIVVIVVVIIVIILYHFQDRHPPPPIPPLAKKSSLTVLFCFISLCLFSLAVVVVDFLSFRVEEMPLLSLLSRWAHYLSEDMNRKQQAPTIVTDCCFPGSLPFWATDLPAASVPFNFCQRIVCEHRHQPERNEPRLSLEASVHWKCAVALHLGVLILCRCTQT